MASENKERFVMPGDVILTLSDGKAKDEGQSGTSTGEKVVKIGPGVRRQGDSLVATKAGLLRSKGNQNLYWVDSNQRRYVPVQGELVIGVIEEKHVEHFKVDIATSLSASLSAFAFEGATKKNKPNLKVGSVVYCKLAVANKDMEPELVCVTEAGKSEGMGELEGGFLFSTSLGLARRLLATDCPVLLALGKHMAFEIVVGMNGNVWINTPSVKYTILVANAILNSEFLTTAQIGAMVKELTKQLD